jgi:hypothetical protein
MIRKKLAQLQAQRDPGGLQCENAAQILLCNFTYTKLPIAEAS